MSQGQDRRRTPSMVTDELKTLQHSLSAVRNHLTVVRCRGEDVAEAAARVKLIRRLTYMDSGLYLRGLCTTWPCDHIGDCRLWYGTVHTRGRPKEFIKRFEMINVVGQLTGHSLLLCSGGGAVEDM
jgi:hypothetical protein